jgi:hypothetical protein
MDHGGPQQLPFRVFAQPNAARQADMHTQHGCAQDDQLPQWPLRQRQGVLPVTATTYVLA